MNYACAADVCALASGLIVLVSFSLSARQSGVGLATALGLAGGAVIVLSSLSGLRQPERSIEVNSPLYLAGTAVGLVLCATGFVLQLS